VSGLLFIAVASQDREARILGETGIGERKIAEEEDGTARGFQLAGVEAIGAEAAAGIVAGGA